MVLDEESAKLTTFDTPFGRYYWRRLPVALSISSEIFQKRIHQALHGLPDLLDVRDDMVIYIGLVTLMNRLMRITTET